MVLEGDVTNVAAFGAFVDVGVHQDGLVHVSALADRFVNDPHEVVRSGQVVKVRVLEVDVARKRIGLSLRLTEATPRAAGGGRPERTPAPRGDLKKGRKPQRGNTSGRQEASSSGGSMAQALRDAGFGR